VVFHAKAVSLTSEIDTYVTQLRDYRRIKFKMLTCIVFALPFILIMLVCLTFLILVSLSALKN